MNRWVPMALLACRPVVPPSAVSAGPATAEVLAPADLDDEDRDHDGLPDSLEMFLAATFSPAFRYDSRHLTQGEGPGGPFPNIAFQAWPQGDAVRVRYGLFWREDHGYGPGSWCRDPHPGDNQSLEVRLGRGPGGGFVVQEVDFGAATLAANDPRIRWDGDAHPVVFLSAHKNHQFWDTTFDGRNSPYSRWGCNDDVDGAGALVLPGVLANVGTADHPLADDMATFGAGYAGEFFWNTTRPFCGGRAPARRCSVATSPVGKMWHR